MVVAYLCLGSNQGDSKITLTNAMHDLTKTNGLKILRQTKPYITAPEGKTDQPDFLNQVIEIETNLPPHELLKHCLSIEKKHGRERIEKWGPRTLDIDILLYGNEKINTPDLIIPHRHMHERKFVLSGLAQLKPEYQPILKSLQ